MAGADPGPSQAPFDASSADRSLRAGLQADAEMAERMGCAFVGIVAVDTEQDELGVKQVRPRSAEAVAEELRAALLRASAKGVAKKDAPGSAAAGLAPRPGLAVKTGALGNAALVEAVASVLEEYPAAPLVVDPVRHPSRSHPGAPPLLDEDGWQAMRARLFPRAALVTPNGDEYGEGADFEACAAVLRTGRVPASEAGAGGSRPQGADGGAATWQVIDTLIRDGEAEDYAAPYLPGADKLHGTGCRLAAAMACRLASGDALPDAVQHARMAMQSWMRERLA